jgi:hypothetical protein
MPDTATPQLTASSFKLTSDTLADRNDLNEAFDYLDQSPTARYVLDTAAKNGTTIDFTSNGNNDAYDSDSNKIIWDPTGALVVHANNVVGGLDVGPGFGPVIGLDSPAIALVHEAAHASDANIAAESSQANWQFGNNSELQAVDDEDLVDQQLGEVQRFSHGGSIYNVQDPTEHTITNADGAMSLVQGGANVEINDGAYTPPNYTQPNLIADLGQLGDNAFSVVLATHGVGGLTDNSASALLSNACTGGGGHFSGVGASLSAGLDLSGGPSGHGGALLKA